MWNGLTGPRGTALFSGVASPSVGQDAFTVEERPRAARGCVSTRMVFLKGIGWTTDWNKNRGSYATQP